MNIHASDYLVHFSNMLLLVSYSVRDILWLRWFAVAAALTNIPYFLSQPETLWPPVLWALVFTVINLYQILRIYLERRPVVLSEDERKLYEMGFRSLRPREFVSLVLAGEWKNAAAGDKVLTEGEPVSSICIPISGTVQVCKHGQELEASKPGHVIGTALALTGDPSPVDATFTEPGRYMCWPLYNIRSFLDRRPELRGTLQSLVNRDLAGKLERLVSA
ncbi:MAG TPA: cyclic nucleotide-binding domain-containing protein [Candidatus Binatia bacterium]